MLGGQTGPVLKLCISYSWEDEQVAREIASLCGELGVEYALDGRNDWLMHGLHDGPEGSTHQLVVVSRANARSWWLPFQLGRAADRGVETFAYLTEPDREPPAFLREKPLVRGLDSLKAMLLAV